MSEAVVSEARREGEVWRGPSGHYFTLKGGHVVPAKDPGAKARPAGSAAPAKAAPAKSGAVSAGAYQAVSDAIAKTGEVPAAARKGNVGRAWEMVKKAGLHAGAGAARKFVAAMKLAYDKMGAGKSPGQAWSEALDETYPPAAHAATAAGAAAVAKIPPAKTAAAVAKVQARADTPEGKAVLARAEKWADAQAAKHAARVAKHLGIDENSARFVLASAIKMLARKALEGGGATQSYTGASGKKITLGVKRKSPPNRPKTESVDGRGNVHKPPGSPDGGQFAGRGGDDVPAAEPEDVADTHESVDGRLYASRGEAAAAAAGHPGAAVTRVGRGKWLALRASPDRGARPVAGLSDAEFAAKVRGAADAQAHGFGAEKVYIADVWAALSAEDPSLSRAEFDRRLLAAHAAGLVELSRADLVQLMDPDVVHRSAVKHPSGVAEFHFLRAAARKRAERPRPTA